MAKYRKKGQIDVYEKGKPGWAGPVIGRIVLVVLIAICAGSGNESDGATLAPHDNDIEASAE